jgi:hypothetical protein
LGSLTFSAESRANSNDLVAPRLDESLKLVRFGDELVTRSFKRRF